ncbi:ROPN1L (predicted) [Pycnogonum litorale]
MNVNHGSTFHKSVTVPNTLPEVLKQYAKAAIRTQPNDLVLWSAAYFRSLSNGENPPVKEYGEFVKTGVGNKNELTVGLLQILHKQFEKQVKVYIPYVKEKWIALCLQEEQLKDILKFGKFYTVTRDGYYKYHTHIDWLQFVAVCCCSIGKDMSSIFKLIIKILPSDEFRYDDHHKLRGYSGSICVATFSVLYHYLAATIFADPEAEILRVIQQLQLVASMQNGFLYPDDFDVIDMGPIFTSLDP